MIQQSRKLQKKTEKFTTFTIIKIRAISETVSLKG